MNLRAAYKKVCVHYKSIQHSRPLSESTVCAQSLPRAWRAPAPPQPGAVPPVPASGKMLTQADVAWIYKKKQKYPHLVETYS